MKVIEQSYEILSLSGVENIEAAGRTCYQSEPKNTCTLNEDDDCYLYPGTVYQVCEEYACPHNSSQQFVKMLNKRGHHAMLEFGDLTVRFITNRGVTHELVRHRLCSFAQESTRYVRYDGDMEFIKPVWLDTVDFFTQATWKNLMSKTEKTYQSLIKFGWKPQQAREVLPNSLKTEIVVKANLREWAHLLKLRTAKAAHPQMRALMLPLLNELKKLVPAIFEDI